MPSHNHKWRGVNTAAAQTQQMGSYPFRIQQDYAANWDGSNWYLQNEGGDQPHENMPPFVTLYMWQRTS